MSNLRQPYKLTPTEERLVNLWVAIEIGLSVLLLFGIFYFPNEMATYTNRFLSGNKVDYGCSDDSLRYNADDGYHQVVKTYIYNQPERN